MHAFMQSTGILKRCRLALYPLLVGLLLVGIPTEAVDLPLYVFDNGVGSGTFTIQKQVQLAKSTGYAGIFAADPEGMEQIPEFLKETRRQKIVFLGIYAGIDLSESKPTYDPRLKKAIRQLAGSGALITLYVPGPRVDGDALLVPLLRDICDQAQQANLKVALYPHHRYHVSRVDHALRLVETVNRPNLGIAFNLCHWLRSKDEVAVEERVRQVASKTWMVSIHGADQEGDWDRLIQPLDSGRFNVQALVKAFQAAGYKGPFGLQCYNLSGDLQQNLKRSLNAWRAF
jgi:sugar phosphate isomerase/epimerase